MLDFNSPSRRVRPRRNPQRRSVEAAHGGGVSAHGLAGGQGVAGGGLIFFIHKLDAVTTNFH